MEGSIERYTGVMRKGRMWLFTILALLLAGGLPTFAAAGAHGPTASEGLSPTDLERVKVGDLAPDFTLEAENGTPLTLSQFRGRRSVILVFYRGHW